MLVIVQVYRAVPCRTNHPLLWRSPCCLTITCPAEFSGLEEALQKARDAAIATAFEKSELVKRSMTRSQRSQRSWRSRRRLKKKQKGSRLDGDTGRLFKQFLKATRFVREDGAVCIRK